MFNQYTNHSSKFDKITYEMFNAYASHSRIAKGLEAARKIMDEAIADLTTDKATVRKLREHWEHTYGHLKIR